ncbi:MAG TPA: hypothetical protein VKG62_09380, partial [Solirubrobacteraceae bacterium]|nr:hypothetical protein [Solirubrobacteraceae bacterium]
LGGEGASCAQASNATAGVAARVVLPPDLQRLEHEMLSLQLTSERFSASVSVSATGGPSGPFGEFGAIKPSSLEGRLAQAASPFGGLAHAASSDAPLARTATTEALITVTGEESFAPVAANVQVSILGLDVKEVLIGTTLYAEEPFIASVDGGRPWVEEPDQHLEQAVGVELGTLGGQPGSGATQAFGGLIEQVNGARNIRELGPRTVDGLPTTEFVATEDPADSHNLSRTQRRELHKLLLPKASLEVFIAEDGLPVRALLRLFVREKHPSHHAELISQTDVLAVNVPVVVAPPPPDETITQAQLDRLLAPKPPPHKKKKRG